MKTIMHIENALKDLDKEIKDLMFQTNVSMKKRDDEVLFIQQQKSVLEQTLSDLKYIQANPPKSTTACKS